MTKKKTICCVVGCYNNSYVVETKDVSYFRLPKDNSRAKLWLKAMGNPPTKKKMYFCELHFDSKVITQGSTRRRLASNAVPTLERPDPAVAEARCRRWRSGRVLVCHQATQTLAAPAPAPAPAHEADPEPKPLIDIFVKEETVVLPPDAPGPSSFTPVAVKQEPPDDALPEPDNPELDMLIKLSQAHLSPVLARFISAQVALKRDITAQGQRSDEEMLLFALQLYHKFPQMYRLMHASLNLPPLKDFQTLFRASTLDELWARALARRFTGATAAERDCVVCVARAPVRRALRYDAQLDRLVGLHEIGSAQWPCAACSGVLIMARGVRARWRQPLACCMLGAGTDIAELRNFLEKLVSKLFDVGLVVRALITDFDSTFAPTSWPVSPQLPFNNVSLGSCKWRLFSFYDCTQLIARFRDFFMQYDINFDGRLASWEDIEGLHEYDKGRACRLAPRLTPEHVHAAGERGAAPAADALAPAVAAALRSAVELGGLPEAVTGTARLVQFIGTLYETLHSKEIDTCLLQPDDEMKFLQKALKNFEKITFVNKETRAVLPDPGVLAAWSTSVRAALALLEATRMRGVTALPMRAFNNDPLHAFFERLRARNDIKVNPTCGLFLASFKKSFALHAIKPVKLAQSENLEDFLKAACEVRRVPREERAPAPAVPGCAVIVKPAHYTGLPAVPQGAARRVLAARVLELCLAAHPGCARMYAYCHSPELPAGFRKFLETLESKFRAYMSGSRAGGGLLGGLLTLVEPEQFPQPCACFPLQYLKTLFMRYRVRSLTQYNNCRLVGQWGAEFALDNPFHGTARWGQL